MYKRQAFVRALRRGASRAAATKKAADALGNSVDVVENNYLAPAVWEYDFKVLGTPPTVVDPKGLTPNERVLLAILLEDAAADDERS